MKFFNKIDPRDKGTFKWIAGIILLIVCTVIALMLRH